VGVVLVVDTPEAGVDRMAPELVAAVEPASADQDSVVSRGTTIAEACVS
jgi:hypothetical protein